MEPHCSEQSAEENKTDDVSVVPIPTTSKPPTCLFSRPKRIVVINRNACFNLKGIAILQDGKK